MILLKKKYTLSIFTWHFCAVVFLFLFAFAQEPQNNTQEVPFAVDDNANNPKNIVLTGEEIDWEKFRDFGFYRLDDVKEEVDRRLKIDTDFRKIVISQIEATNVGVINSLKIFLGENYAEIDDYDLLRKLLLEAFNPVDKENSVTISPVEREASLSGLLLNYAARVLYYENIKNDKTESMVELFGDVRISIGGNTISANYVLLNLTTGEVFAEDEVFLQNGANFFSCERFVYNLKDNQGYAGDASGVLEERFFKSEFVTVNEDGNYTIKNGWITFSITPDPFYVVKGSVITSFGEEKVISWNTVFKVGDHNFFWFPYYIAYPLTTGVKMRFGENRRAGFYALNEVSLDAPKLGEVGVNVNIYEKLGLYLQFVNVQNFDWISYNFLLGLSVYTENLNVRDDSDNLLYTHQTDPYINSPSFLRHILKYEQKIYLNKAEILFGKKAGSSDKANFNQTLQADITNVSDPFISDNFRGDYSHMDWLKIIERHSRNESLYISEVTDYNFYKLFYSTSLPGLVFSSSFSWSYDVYQDPEKDEEDPIDERYKSYLRSLEIPSLKFMYSNFLDKQQSDGERAFYLDIGYQIHLDYFNKKEYKDGDVNEDSAIDSLVEPYGLLYETSDFSTGFQIFRTFRLGEDLGSTIVLPIDWFSWSITPKFIFGFHSARIPIQNTASNNLRDDYDSMNMVFSLGNVLGINTVKEAWADMSFSNSINLQETRSEYFLTKTERLANSDFNFKNIAVNYSFASSIKVNIPSGAMASEWARSYDYTSMLPTANFNLSYNQGKFTSADKSLDKSKKYDFDRFNSRDFSSSIGFVQKGYGLFYAPMLDYILSSSVGFRYDLMPFEDEDGNYGATSFFEDIDEFWREERIKSFDGKTSLNISYFFASLSNSLTYNFFNTDENKIVPELNNYSLGFAINYNIDDRKKKNPWFSFDSFYLKYNWSYNFLEKLYNKDSMVFSMGMNFLLLRYTKFSFGISAANPNAARYFKKKSDFLGFPESVNFFEDVVNSFGFSGNTKQEAALFKFNQFNMSVSHDLGDWFAKFSYVLSPVSFAENSFRGYYLDHKIEFEVNLLPSRDPRGAGSEPLFNPVEESFAPTL